MTYLELPGHPEQLDGEKFIGNRTIGGFNNIAWKTKRLGIAIENPKVGNGEGSAPTMYPVFVGLFEINAEEIKSARMNFETSVKRV